MKRNKQRRKSIKSIAWVVVIAMIGLTSASVNAQVQKIGVTGGVNIANFNGATGISSSNGLIIGGFVRYDLIGGLALEPEVLFSMKGGSGTYYPVITFSAHPLVPLIAASSGKYTWTLNYVEIPVLLRFNVLSVPVLPVSIGLFAGPDFAFNVVSKNKMTVNGVTTTTDEAGNTRAFDFNIAVGGGPNIDLGLTTLSVELRYTFGTGTVFKSGGVPPYLRNARNGVWSVMASATF